MKLQILAIVLLLACSAAFGQGYAFKVVASKGANEVKSGDTWLPLKAGSSLMESDELRLGENSYIGLVHTSGKPIEVKKPGNYPVKELAEKVPQGNGALSKYTDFILSSNSAEAKKNRLSATGAVVRDVQSANAIKLMLPENQHSGIFNTTAVVTWEGAQAQGPYIVTVRNMFDDILDKIETTETSVTLDLGNPKYATENALLVEVSAKSDPKVVSKQHLIKKLTPTEQKAIQTDLNEIIGDVADPTALNKFLLAGFYEHNNLFIDAIAAYEEAIRLAPDVPTFQEGYEEFLLRHGLK
jgi:hypothetical protein